MAGVQSMNTGTDTYDRVHSVHVGMGERNNCSNEIAAVSRRPSTASVEVLLLLPILSALMVGLLDIGWLFHVENAMDEAAQAVAREVSAGAAADLGTRLDNYAYPFTVAATDADSTVTVTISVPLADVALIDLFDVVGGGEDMRVSATVAKRI